MADTTVNAPTIAFEATQRDALTPGALWGATPRLRLVTDYRVLIDGEHRATFAHTDNGFVLKVPTKGYQRTNGRTIRVYAFAPVPIRKADFDRVVREELKRRTIPN
jgi:hypothetical protein